MPQFSHCLRKITACLYLSPSKLTASSLSGRAEQEPRKSGGSQTLSPWVAGAGLEG